MNQQKRSGEFQIGDYLKANLETIKKVQKDGQGALITGLPTGFSLLDRLTRGLNNSDLIVLAGYPMMGKTTLALNIARNLAVDQGVPTLIFSTASPGEQLSFRILKAETRLSPYPLSYHLKLKPEDWDKIESAYQTLSKAPLYLDASPGISIDYLKTQAPVLKEKYGLGLIILDYFQLLKGAYSQPEKAARSLKYLAQDLDIPIMVLFQIGSREDLLENNRPSLVDVLESGNFGEYGDLVILVHRDFDYISREEDVSEEDRRMTEIIIAKNERGPTGFVRLIFYHEHGLFMSFDQFFAEKNSCLK